MKYILPWAGLLLKFLCFPVKSLLAFFLNNQRSSIHSRLALPHIAFVYNLTPFDFGHSSFIYGVRKYVHLLSTMKCLINYGFFKLSNIHHRIGFSANLSFLCCSCYQINTAVMTTTLS